MIPSFFLCVYIYILIVWFVFSVGVYAQLDDAFIKEFGGKDKTMKEKVNWDAPILGPLDYINKWCIMLRTKAFHLISNGTSAFAKSSLIYKVFGGGIAIKRWIFRYHIIFLLHCFNRAITNSMKHLTWINN